MTVTVTRPVLETVAERPVQEAPDTRPVVTSQYVPAGRRVWKVFVRVEPALKAAKPRSPRLNAIWLEPLVHQPLTSVPRVVLRKPTISAMRWSRCWQVQPLRHTGSSASCVRWAMERQFHWNRWTIVSFPAAEPRRRVSRSSRRGRGPLRRR